MPTLVSDRSVDRRRALAAECAARLVDVAPLIMRRVRARMRREMPDLTVPQFRSLVYIEVHRGCALRALADHLGTTPATSSALVDRLVQRGWVTRATDAANRRQVRLALTARGETRLGAARAAARREIAHAIADAPVAALLAARSGLDGLRELFLRTGAGGGR
ncbi:MAG TPA: MarR family transcriptional regulator [bacterium]|jgi:DNA-binding MarR family transcriptional regulator|nr:MarR family transcriptional regulator [bacterium]